MHSLSRLTKEVKKGNEEAFGEIIDFFNPKLNKNSRTISVSNQDDLKQELKIEIVKAIQRFDISYTPTFFDFLKSLKHKTF